MKGHSILFGAACWLVFIFNVPATVFYVDVNSTNPVSPYADWSTASTDIQSAIDVSTNGDLILVTNGLYNTGGRVVYDALTNRVVINKAVTVQSVNGPSVTVIQGYQVSQGSTAYNNDVRCVYMTNYVVLDGFAITGGAAPASGGGVFCESTNSILTNCVLNNNLCSLSDFSAGGGAIYQGTLNGCILSNNLANYVNGGAAYYSVLNNCLIISNTAGLGGGAAFSTLNHSTVIGNVATSHLQFVFGGGTFFCTANDCLIAGNCCIGLVVNIGYGGGDCAGILNGCILSNNVAAYGGGGARLTDIGTLNNCLVISNTASINGGGIYGVPVYNSTIIGNTATMNMGGGVYGGSFRNCIIYGNTCNSSHPNACNFGSGSFVYCCTTPLPGGIGNITNDPVFVNLADDDFHLQSNSPCINSGNNTYVTNNDLDGNPRIVSGTVDMGAYEFQSPVSQISYAWLYQYGLPINASTDFSDADGDGMSNYAEWKAGTNPTNSASVLALQAPATTNTTGITVTWQSVSGVTYYLQSSTNLPAYTAIQSNIVGQAGTTSYTDTTATNGGPYFYRVGVQ